MFLTRLSVCIQSNYEEYKLNNIMNNDSNNSSLKLLQDFNSKLKYEQVVDLQNHNQNFINLIIQVLRNKELLIVLDNCEDPLEDDCDSFVHKLDMLLDECSSITIMLTSRKYINKLEHNIETPYHMYSLTPQASLKLLLEKAPREINNKEIEDLLKYEIPSNHSILQLFPSINSSEITMTNHPFILMLGGHPQAISLAAPMLEHQTLTELFQQLIDSNIMDALSFKGKQSYTSLRISFEISINNIQKQNPQALDLFKLIGLLPGGIKQTELTELWGSNSWKSLKDDLIRASLLVNKPSENILTLLPFMNTRAYELLETEEAKKNEFHIKICKFYKNFLKNFEDKMNKNSSNLNDFVEKEANIWACIYRSINRKKDNNEYDEEESEYLQLNTLSDGQSTSFDDDLQRHSTMQTSNLMQFQSPFFEGIEDIEEIKEEEKEDEKDETKDDKEENDKSEFDSVDLDNENLSPKNQLSSRPSMNKHRMSVNNAKDIKRLSTKIRRLSTDNIEIKPLKNLRKSASSIVTENNKFKDEEMLVVQYISIVIRLLKFSDGLKAISEYEKKEGLTKRAQAHILKLKGVIGLLSDKSEESQIEQTIDNFTKSLDLFHKIGSSKGRAICRLALVRVQGERELKKDDNKNSINNLIAIADKARQQFSKIGYKPGEARASQYVEFLKKRLKGENDENFNKILKFKTLKRNHIETVKQNDSLLEKNMLQNEDIKLFVEVIEEETDQLNESRRFASVVATRTATKQLELKPSLLPQLSPLSLSLSSSKFSTKKKIKVLHSKGKRIKMRSTKSSFSNYARNNLAKSFKVEPLFRFNKNTSSESSLK